MTLTLDVPTASAQDSEEMREKRLRAAIALYDAQFITQGQAAQIAGLPRVEFFDELGRHGVTPFQYDWQEEMAQVLKMTNEEERKNGQEGY